MDYCTLWQQQFTMAQGEQKQPQYYEDAANACRYNDSQPIRLDGVRRAREFGFEADASVLDIGPGPGTLALPLAPRVGHITAVEPSAWMRTLLEQQIQQQGIQNIRILPQRWEDADPKQVGVHDYVIASYSLHMPQIGPALCKMNALARKKVILYWFSGVASWEKRKMDLLPIITGRPFFAQPKSDVLYGALCQQGFYPQVTPLVDTQFSYDYPSMQDAVNNLQQVLGIQGGYDTLLQQYIRQNYQHLPGGGWRFCDKTHYVRLEWQPVQGGQ